MKRKLIKRVARLFSFVFIGSLIIGVMNLVTPAGRQFNNALFAQEFHKTPNIVRLPIVATSDFRTNSLPGDKHFITSSDLSAKSQVELSPQIPKNKLNKLEEIRTGQHDGYCSVVFQFKGEVVYDGLFIIDGELHFTLQRADTELDRYMEYRGIPTWVLLEGSGNDIDVIIGIPPDFQSPRLFFLKAPDRLVINFYPDNRTTKGSSVLIKPVTISEPTVIAPSEETETGSPFFRGKITDMDDGITIEVKEASEVHIEESPSKGQTPDAESPELFTEADVAVSKGSSSGKGGGFMAFGPPLLQGSNYRVKITPKISIREEYDDNIFLVKENTDADWITTVSPGFEIDIESDKNGLELDYTFGWVRYYNNTSNDNMRHSGRLKFWQKLTEHLKLNIEDRYLKSDDIFDEDLSPTLPSQRVANNRSRYQRNDATANLEYDFGPRSRFTTGYVYNILDNEDPNLEDMTEKGPFVGLSHWFDNKNSIDFDYRFAEYEYTQKGISEARPNIEVQETGFIYSHRFSERVKPFLSYRIYHQNFMGIEKSYWIHNFGGGIGYAFSQKTSFDIFLGGYYPSGDTTTDPGMTFTALLKRDFRRGSFSLGADTGWDTGFTEVIPRGFTRYYGGLAQFDYQIMEKLGVYADTSYRQNRYPSDELDIIGGYDPSDDKTYTGRCGLNYRFYQWFSLDLSYTYRQRFSDDPDNEFVDNRFMLRFNAAKPFRW